MSIKKQIENIELGVEWKAAQKATHRLQQMLADEIAHLIEDNKCQNAYPNVWLGATCGVRSSYPRVDALRTIPARVRFISAEPLLESLADINLSGIHWLVAGGESGPKFRTMYMEWARELRDRCHAQGVGFFFKQESAFRPATSPILDGKQYHELPMVPECSISKENRK